MNTAEEFMKSGYIIIRNMIPTDEVARLYKYTLENLDRGNTDDGQVPGSPSFYQDKEVVSLQKKLLPTIEESIKLKLIPIFCYNRIYRTGAILRVHKDSHRAEISATINVGQQGDPWDLWLVDYDENPQNITLNPGDGLIYYGNKLHHWRGKLVKSDFVSQIMFHFAPRNRKNVFIAKMEMIRKVRKCWRQLFGISY